MQQYTAFLVVVLLFIFFLRGRREVTRFPGMSPSKSPEDTVAIPLISSCVSITQD